MFIQDTEQSPIKMLWEGLMKGTVLVERLWKVVRPRVSLQRFGGGYFNLALRLTGEGSDWTLWMMVFTLFSSHFYVANRFILSLASCKNCMVIDDQLNILPISSHTLTIAALPTKSKVKKSSTWTVSVISMQCCIEINIPYHCKLTLIKFIVNR